LTCANAKNGHTNGHSKCLKYLQDNGCPE